MVAVQQFQRPPTTRMLPWFSGLLFNTLGLSIFQQLCPYIWSRTNLPSTCQKEIRLSKGFVKKPLDETVSKGLLLVQMLVWWLGRSHKHHGQRPLLGDLQGTFITSQDIGRLECQLKTCLMVMSYDSSKWADVEHISYPTPTSVLLSGLVFRSYVSQCFTTLFLLYMSVP